MEKLERCCAAGCNQEGLITCCRESLQWDDVDKWQSRFTIPAGTAARAGHSQLAVALATHSGSRKALFAGKEIAAYSEREVSCSGVFNQLSVEGGVGVNPG